MLSLGKHPGVAVLADVPDVTPYYAAARLAVAPIRAGGGSRIKILEAFAHDRPVVSTRIGAEGLSVVDGRHLLIADTAGTAILVTFAGSAVSIRKALRFDPVRVLRGDA